VISSMYEVILYILHPELPRRTSEMDGGLYVVSEFVPGVDRLSLARMGPEGHEKLISVGTGADDRLLPDRIFVLGDRVIILVPERVSNSFKFYRRGKRGFVPEYWPVEPEFSYPCDNIIKLGDDLLGCTYLSPDLSPELAGNYLFVFGPSGLKFGRLPKEGWFEVSKGRKNSEFILDRWIGDDLHRERSIQKVPLKMNGDTWVLSNRWKK